jgi:signal transduction histidine kinase
MSDRDLVPMDIQPAISAAVEAVTRQQTEKEVVIGSAVLPGQHFILANHYLNDLFLNIVSNSVKFDGARKVKVEITVSDENTPQGAYWVVSVADRGRGIPDDRKKAVFERFATGMTGIKGFGLGLSIVSTIIEKYGGRIWVEDRISGDFSKGAVFKIMLPKAVKPSETKHLAA